MSPQNINEGMDTVTPPFISSVGDIHFLSRVNHDCQPTHTLIKENILTNERLQNTIELFNSNLITYSPNNVLEYLMPIISVIIGGFLGFFLNEYHRRVAEEKEKNTNFFTKIFTLISELESLSVGYWIKDTCEDDVGTEVYIKSRIRLLTNYVESVDAKRVEIKTELEKFISEIFDLVTGDEFESKDRKASKSKATSISYRCTDINARVATHC